jgi:hypothetical protein
MSQSYLEIPHEQWPGEIIYFYCPDCDTVRGIEKGGRNRCPGCGKNELKDIFVEITERLATAWTFFDRTRYEENPRLYRYEPGGEVSFFATNLAMALYGELRAMGFTCPWKGSDDEIIGAWIQERLRYLDPVTGLLDCSGIGGYLWYSSGPTTLGQYVSSGFAATLESRLFEPDAYRVPIEVKAQKDSLESVESFHELLGILPNSYGGGSWITAALANHRDILEARGETVPDEMIEYVHRWLDEDQDPKTGRWLAFADKEYNPDTIANGMFKVMVSYRDFNWKIHYPEQIIDFLIDERSDPRTGFAGDGTCSIFDPMMVAWMLRTRGCNHRKEEINLIVANSFLAFKDRWDTDRNWFKNNTWQEKHNIGTPLYMASIILELPLMNNTGIYNWRRNPVITRGVDGSVSVNEVIYTA